MIETLLLTAAFSAIVVFFSDSKKLVKIEDKANCTEADYELSDKIKNNL